MIRYMYSYYIFGKLIFFKSNVCQERVQNENDSKVQSCF